MNDTKILSPRETPDKTERGDRWIAARWVLAKAEDGKESQVVLDVRHHGRPGYRYRASLRNTRVEYRGVFTVETFDLLGGLVLLDVPANRFSEKGLAAAYQVALAELRKRADDPAVSAYFSNAADRT